MIGSGDGLGLTSGDLYDTAGHVGAISRPRLVRQR
jgi:hypothetical protein